MHGKMRQMMRKGFALGARFPFRGLVAITISPSRRGARAIFAPCFPLQKRGRRISLRRKDSTLVAAFFRAIAVELRIAESSSDDSDLAAGR